MEGGSVISSFCSPKTHLPFNLCNSPSPSPPSSRHSVIINFQPRRLKCHVASSSSRISPPLSRTRAVAEAVEHAAGTSPSSSKGVSHRTDKSGRFCNPRAARELALLIAYAACLEGSDPVRLFDKRVNAKRDPGYVFHKASLSQYDHMSFGGAPVEVGTEEEAEELMLKNEKDSANEAEVLSAPLKLVYNKFVLRLTREILGAVGDRWDEHVLIIDKVIPPNWKDEPAARILELCILHLAMAEITVIGTRHQIVINEAVDLTKRFCDGCAPRIINGCLRTFVKDHSTVDAARPLESSKS